MHLGPIFKQIRLSKQISLRTAAGDACSPSLLSRFENEQIDITSGKLVAILNNIQVSLTEFSHHIHPKNTLSSMIFYIRQLRDENRIDCLSQLYQKEKQLAENDHHHYHLINSLIIKLYLYSLGQGKQLSPDELAFLHDWLFTLETWGEQEIELFSISSIFLTPRLYATYTQDLLKKVDMVALYPLKRHALLLNGLMLCVSQEEYQIASYFKDLIEQDFYPERDTYYRILYKWTCGLWQSKTTNLEQGLSQMEEAVSILEVLDCHQSAQYYRQETDSIRRQLSPQ